MAPPIAWADRSPPTKFEEVPDEPYGVTDAQMRPGLSFWQAIGPIDAASSAPGISDSRTTSLCDASLRNWRRPSSFVKSRHKLFLLLFSARNGSDNSSPPRAKGV